MPGALYAPTDNLNFRACELLVEDGLLERDPGAPMACYSVVV
jgi:hypothetical protein